MKAKTSSKSWVCCLGEKAGRLVEPVGFYIESTFDDVAIQIGHRGRHVGRILLFVSVRSSANGSVMMNFAYLDSLIAIAPLECSSVLRLGYVEPTVYGQHVAVHE